MVVRRHVGPFPLRLNDHNHTKTLSLRNMKIHALMRLSPDKVSKNYIWDLENTILEIINSTNDDDEIT